MNSNVSAWTFGGSILSFAFPMLLFIVVAGALYVLYTKPEFVPGHRAPGAGAAGVLHAGAREARPEAAQAAARRTARPAAEPDHHRRDGRDAGAADPRPRPPRLPGEAAETEDAE